jgi:hypothetical protein
MGYLKDDAVVKNKIRQLCRFGNANFTVMSDKKCIFFIIECEAYVQVIEAKISESYSDISSFDDIVYNSISAFLKLRGKEIQPFLIELKKLK